MTKYFLQRTLSQSVSVSGTGVHSGKETHLMIKLSNALDVGLDYLLKNDKNRVTGKGKDAELINQFVKMDAVPDLEGHMLKALLDAFIKKHQFKALAMK